MATFFTKAAAFLLSIFITAVPFSGIKLPILKTSEEDCLLNVELISDLHIEEKELFRKAFLKTALRHISNSKSPVDAVLITGDITNYADEPALKAYYEIMEESCPCSYITVMGNHDVGHSGDRDVTEKDKYKAKQNFIDYLREYADEDIDTIYFSTEINGYKFICLGDEVDGFTIDENGEEQEYLGGHWDGITMTHEQLEFFDEELAEGTEEGKPVFVCCHWAIKGINGEPIIWDDSGIDQTEYNLVEIMEKYNNVYYISGHMHGGVRATVIGEKYDMPMAQQVNGVTYISLPTFGIINQYGIPWSGTGAQLEVYSDKIVFRPINFLLNKWYQNSAYTFELTPSKEEPVMR